MGESPRNLGESKFMERNLVLGNRFYYLGHGVTMRLMVSRFMNTIHRKKHRHSRVGGNLLHPCKGTELFHMSLCGVHLCQDIVVHPDSAGYDVCVSMRGFMNKFLNNTLAIYSLKIPTWLFANVKVWTVRINNKNNLANPYTKIA